MEYLTPAPPRLNAQILTGAGNKVVLSWGITNFILQYKTGSITNTNWVDSPDPVYQDGNNYYVTNTIGAASRWYRLRHPL